MILKRDTKFLVWQNKTEVYQVSGKSKHSLLAGHTRRKPYTM
jgi:hypothetical protein